MTPRRYGLKPRYARPKVEERRIIFQSKSYNRRYNIAGRPVILIALLILVMAIIYVLGGLHKPVKPVDLNLEDVVGIREVK